MDFKPAVDSFLVYDIILAKQIINHKMRMSPQLLGRCQAKRYPDDSINMGYSL
jgi:hypothetical protein